MPHTRSRKIKQDLLNFNVMNSLHYQITLLIMFAVHRGYMLTRDDT